MPAQTKDYRTVAASQTAQAIGAPASPVGSRASRGDEIDRIVITPTTTAPGIVTLKDGASGTGINVYTGGTVSAALEPFEIDLGIRAVNAEAAEGWHITTGANLTLIVIGRFKRR